MTEALMVYETLDSSQIKDIMDNKKCKPPAGWDDKDDKIKTIDDYLDTKPDNLVDLLRYYELVKEIKVANGIQI